MSSFVFRLFENLNVNEEDPRRFRLEIMVNRGAATNPQAILNVKAHTIPIKMENYIDMNKNLTLEKIDMFLRNLMAIAPTVEAQEKWLTNSN